MKRIALSLLLALSLLPAAEQPETIDLRVDDAPLLHLLERIARQCKAGLIVHRDVASRLEQAISIDVKASPWADAVDLLRKHYRLAIALEDGRLKVVDADVALRADLVMKTYDVRHLLQGRIHYPGPMLDIPEPGFKGGIFIPEITDEEPAIEDLVDLIRELVPARHWAIEGSQLSEWDGQLVVIQRPEQQQMVSDILRQLELDAARQLVVRVWVLDATAVPNPLSVLPAARWAELQATLAAPHATWVMSDESRNHHFSGQQSVLLTDMDAVNKSYDPIPTVANSGLAVDIEASVTIGGVLVQTRFASSRSHQPRASTIASGTDTLGTLEIPQQALFQQQDARLVPPGAAACYPVGDRLYALTFDILDYASPAAAGSDETTD